MAGLLGVWARLLGVAVVGLAALALYTYFPPLVQLDPQLATLAEDYPTSRILRDPWGIPHVFARTDAEVAFGLAYAHAQDDFTTIQKALLASRGRLAALDGKSGYVNDYLVHLLRLQDRVKHEYDRQLSVQMRKVLRGYADGLNFFAYLHSGRIIAADLFPITPQVKDVVVCFVHKIPSFIKLDKIVHKMIYPTAGNVKTQRLVNLEMTKSNMSQVFGQRWHEIQAFFFSLFNLLPAQEPEITESEPSNIAIPSQTHVGSASTDEIQRFMPVFASSNSTLGESQQSGSEEHQLHLEPMTTVVYAQAEATAQPTESNYNKVETDDSEDTTDTGVALASNAFALSGRASSDGSTMLAINSHQPWLGPFSSYEAHLHSEEGWNFVGGVLPGSPIPLSGHNQYLGWANTMNTPDVIDVYQLTIDTQDKMKYLFDGQWHSLERRTVPIAIKLFGRLNWEVKREILWSPSHNAPVIQNALGTFALRYSGSERINQLEQWFNMTKATTFKEWKAAASSQTMPHLNTIYADHRGNIFYVYNALLPTERSPAYDWSSAVPGNTSSTLWAERYLPWDELPQTLNPSSGFLQNCNSSPFRVTKGHENDNPLPHHYHQFDGMIERRMTNRALRAVELFSAALDPKLGVLNGSAKTLNLDEFLQFKFDKSYSEKSFMAYLLNHSLSAYRQQANSVGIESLKKDRPMLVRAITLLESWDMKMSSHSVIAPLAYFAFNTLLDGSVAQRFYDICGDDTEHFSWPSLAQLGLTSEQLIDAIEMAARNLKWSLGRLDPEWKRVQKLARGRSEFEIGGGPDVLHTVNGVADEKKGRVMANSGDGYIQIVRWDSQGRIHPRAIQPFGSNNHQKSPHFKDQTALFITEQLREVWMEERELEARLTEAYRPGSEMELGARRLGPLGEIAVQRQKHARATHQQQANSVRP